MRRLAHILAVAVLLSAVSLHATDLEFPPEGTGLESASSPVVPLTYCDLSEDAEELGLTADRISTKAELKLRLAGLQPTDDPGEDGTLWLCALVHGGSYTLRLQYNRWVLIATGSEEYLDWATTWETGVGGTHAGDPENIVGQLDILLDEFVNEYMAANGG